MPGVCAPSPESIWGKSESADPTRGEAKPSDAERVSSASKEQSKARSLELDGFQVSTRVLHYPEETLQQSWDWRAPIAKTMQEIYLEILGNLGKTF